jgi:murein DD-endopeptidase MepM/ murein hydrolase activator NlpD
MKAPLRGRISSKFGSRVHPITGKASFHNGVDVAVPIGTDIVAPEAGKVTECWDHPKGGVCMAMMSDTGTRYGFAHLSKRLVNVGDLVKEGQHVAESGNTGGSTGPHLHFTVKKGGTWMDPTRYFNFF